MADLSENERITIEDLLNMGEGLVLNFNDRNFRDFILREVKIDIDNDKYKNVGKSKAKRLRSFWEQEPNYVVGKLLLSFLEYWKTQNPINTLIAKDNSKALFEECIKISQRLMGEREDLNEVVDVSAHFEEIQEQILEQIESARFLIWIAVAWFTDKTIFNKLVAKKNQGINVQLTIVDDNINKSSEIDYENEFETYRIPEFGKYKNIMHNKFCVVDLRTVISGSYNFTNKAQFNHESITVVNSHENAEKFAEKFIKLKLIILS